MATSKTTADPADTLQTMQASATDILRWLLLIAFDRRVTVDRRMDIIRAAERIIEKAKQL